MEWWRSTSGKEVEDKEEAWLPPGFRFHPTDEELLTFYLRRKAQNANFRDGAIAEVDFNKVEPWDLPGRAKTGEKEWYFFSLLDRKYPTGMRTNRATDAGYWKATGKDREIACSHTSLLIGMKKTLVFYKGRAPRGEKTNWVIHEYRLEGGKARDDFQRLCKEEWVVCRVFKKSMPATLKTMASLEINRRPCHEIDAFLPALESPHMPHLPSCSPFPNRPQQETPLFHSLGYNQCTESIVASNIDNNIALGSTYLHLPTASFSIAAAATTTASTTTSTAPFCSLQEEAEAAGSNKAHHPLSFFLPSSSNHSHLSKQQQQYSNYYPLSDCKIETLYNESFVNSEFTVAEGTMFAHSTISNQDVVKESRDTVAPLNEATGIPLDHLMPTGTCKSRVIPPEFDSLWAF